MPSTTYIPAHARPPYYASPPPPSPSAGPSRARSPRYAPPDTDPSLPLPRTMSSSDSEDANGGGQDLEYSQAQYDAEQAREDPNELHPGYEEPYDPLAAAGPSRKRPRTDEFANGNGKESSNGGSDSFQPRSSSSFVPRSRPPDPPLAQAEDHAAYEQDGSAAEAGYGPPGGVVHGEGYDVPIAPSIFGIAPRNEFTKTIGEFIMANARGRENVEVEIKLGTLMGADGGQGPPRRMRMPAMSEMILPPDYPIGHFNANMTKGQNQSLNMLLNSATQSAASTPSPIRFFRAQHSDSFYETSGTGHGRGKVRVSRDRQGNIVQGGCIVKRRIADVNVVSPREALDFRVSVSTETPCPVPSGQPTMIREKDRACYQHQLVQVDLTVVTTKPAGGGPATNSYEIEIEVLDVPALVAEGEKEEQGLPNRFDEILQSCLDSARMLIRNVG